MLTIAHASTGALIATKIPNPLLSVPLILLSHYVLDYILHWDMGTGLSNGSKPKIVAILQELTIDMTLTAAFLFLFFERSSPGINTAAWLGAFISLIPDFLESPKTFLNWEPKWLAPLNRFHHHFHHSTPNMITGLTPQLVLLFLISLAA